MVPVRVAIALGVLAVYGVGCAQQRLDGIFDGAFSGHATGDGGDPSLQDAGPGGDDTGAGLDDTGAGTEDTGPPTGDDAGPLVLDAGTGTDPCGTHRSCAPCGATSGCGWCGATSACMSGTTRGPRGATCAGAWGISASACGTTGGGTGACSTSTACGACTALSNCGWCATTHRCAAGTLLGPTTGTCSAAAWSWVPTDCTGTTDSGTTDPCAGQSACGTCITNPNCGWCLDTMSCHYATTRHSGPDDHACSGSTWAYSTTYCSH